MKVENFYAFGCGLLIGGKTVISYRYSMKHSTKKHIQVMHQKCDTLLREHKRKVKCPAQSSRYLNYIAYALHAYDYILKLTK